LLPADLDASVCLNARQTVREPPIHPGESSILRMKQEHPAGANQCVKNALFPQIAAADCFRSFPLSISLIKGKYNKGGPGFLMRAGATI
jgi:hypothetical protein